MKTKELTQKEKIEVYDEAENYLIKKFKGFEGKELRIFFNMLQENILNQEIDELNRIVNKLATDDIRHIWEEIDKLKKEKKKR